MASLTKSDSRFNPINPGFWGIFPLACIFISCLTGCIHLHNENNAKTAAEALQLYRSFQTNSGDVFDVMLANSSRAEQALAQREDLAARQNFQVMCSSVGYMTWELLQTNLEAAAQANSNDTAELDQEMQETAKQQLNLDANLTTAQQALDKLDEQVASAQKERLKWMARGEFFNDVLIYYTAQVTNLSKLDKKLLESAKDSIETNIVEGTNTIKDLLQDDLKDLEHFNLKSVAEKYSVDLFNPQKAPGITVQILSLGADMAAAEVARVQLDIAWLNSLQDWYTNSGEALGNQKHHIKMASSYVQSIVSDTNYIPGVNILQYINKDSTNSYADLLLTRDVSAIQLYLFAETLDKSKLNILAGQPDAIAHDHSIRLSKINAGEREAIILRALQGLNAYHQGGITPEEIANLIQAAEAAGIGVIGARVGH